MSICDTKSNFSVTLCDEKNIMSGRSSLMSISVGSPISEKSLSVKSDNLTGNGELLPSSFQDLPSSSMSLKKVSKAASLTYETTFEYDVATFSSKINALNREGIMNLYQNVFKPN